MPITITQEQIDEARALCGCDLTVTTDEDTLGAAATGQLEVNVGCLADAVEFAHACAITLYWSRPDQDQDPDGAIDDVRNLLIDVCEGMRFEDVGIVDAQCAVFPMLRLATA